MLTHQNVVNSNSHQGQDEFGIRVLSRRPAPISGPERGFYTADGAPKVSRRRANKHPFANKNTRLGSFEEWPKDQPVKPHSLADAGFYYTGQDDRVQCFTCGIQVHNWEDGDQPWVEHARLSGTCNFVQSSKGVEFVEDVKMNRPVHHHLFHSQELM